MAKVVCFGFFSGTAMGCDKRSIRNFHAYRDGNRNPVLRGILGHNLAILTFDDRLFHVDRMHVYYLDCLLPILLDASPSTSNICSFLCNSNSANHLPAVYRSLGSNFSPVGSPLMGKYDCSVVLCGLHLLVVQDALRTFCQI